MSDQRYRYHAGLDGMRDAAANFIMEIGENSLRLPAKLWRPWYRVVAVDAEGRRSGPSAMAELPHPLITTAELPAARAGAPYEAAVAASASIGHLVSADENGKAYQMRFRTGDELSFEAAGAPEGIAIDSRTGRLSGQAGAPGKYNLKLTARDARTGASDTVSLVLTVAR
jgi:protein involved in polysaccharide export with SLBB domain